MHVAYFRELRPYTEDEIKDELSLDSDSNRDETRSVIRTLMSRGVMRYRTGDEQNEEELVDTEGASDKQRYQFRFVGIVIACGHPIVCYPKYIRSTDRPKDQMRQTLEVIRKLGQEGKLLDQQGDGTHEDQLSLTIRLLWLYDEYGIYSNYEETRILNGMGVIDWQRTIDSVTPVISNGVPVYLDLWTRKTRRDEYDLIMRLHRAILSEASRFLDDYGLADLLSIETVELTDESPSDLGETEYLKWLIDRERARQYVTWKQDLLELMRLYLSDKGAEAENGEPLRLGTTSYYHAWELACKEAFGDLLELKLQDLPHIKLKGKWAKKKYEDKTLLQIMPKSLWERPGDRRRAAGYLIPDTITFAESNGRLLFCIYDAKYYVPILNKDGNIQRQPGVESITKQFLYQSAYKGFIKRHDFDTVVNAFLVPSEKKNPELLASTTYPGVMKEATSACKKFSSHINMWAIPASEIFECYLTGRSFDIGRLL